jgi:hypothetical protein
MHARSTQRFRPEPERTGFGRHRFGSDVDILSENLPRGGQYVLDFVVNIILWFGGYLLTLVSVPALFVAAPAWIVRRLRGPARSAFIENKARN